MGSVRFSMRDEARLVERLRRTRQPGFELASMVQQLLESSLDESVEIAADLLERYADLAKPQFRFEVAAVYHLARVRGLVKERQRDWRAAALAYRDGAAAAAAGTGDLPLLLARVALAHGLSELFSEAVALLERDIATRVTPLPVVQFEHHLLAARLSAELGRRDDARSHARLALEWAAKAETGLQKHKHLLLVPPLDPGIEGELRAIIDDDAKH